MEHKTVKIYTDGSAHYKTQYGAWAFIVIFPDGREVERVQSYEGVTNNRMELAAVLEALDFIVKLGPDEHGGHKYQIVSDSEYVVNGINEWLAGWKAKGWKNVKNLQLWLAMDTVLAEVRNRRIKLSVTWVKGHNGDEYNEKCDKLAHGEYKRLLEEKEKLKEPKEE